MNYGFPEQILASFELSLAIVSLIVMFFRLSYEKMREGRWEMISFLAWCSALMLVDYAASQMNGRPGETVRPLLYVLHTVNYVIPLLLIVKFLNMNRPFMDVSAGRDRLMHVIKAIVNLEVVMVLLNVKYGFFFTVTEANRYARGPHFRIHVFVMIALLALCLYCYEKYGRHMGAHKRSAYFVYLILPGIGALLSCFISLNVSLANLAIGTAGIVLCIVMMHDQMNAVQEDRIRFLQAEQEMHDMQQKLFLSQMRPHFLFNVLNSIYYIVDKDPDKAKQAISDFSGYLRANIDTVTTDEVILFSQELTMIRKYLSLEKLRFEEDLQVTLDIREERFHIPALSIQPLVENAVKYNVGRKEGVRILLKTERIPEGFRITVEDNGSGFDPEHLPEDDRTHIGIELVRRRLEMTHAGSLTISSVPGQGTRAVVELKNNENRQ